MKKLISLPYQLVLALLRRPQTLIAIGIVSLCALIWFAGPSLGMASVGIRLILMGGIILAWVLFRVYDWYQTSQSAQLLEESLQQQGEDHANRLKASPSEEIESVRLQFQKAITTLKQSKLGKGYRGRAALYALPWYMFIGPSASGKSTALRESGLQFPYLGENRKGVQGIGGTRNCDWWFTSEAVLLDTAGRYVSEDEDREEWFAFLDLLRKARKRKPINGVIVAIGVNDLLQAREQEVEWHAQKIRDRIEELMTRLGLTFPVYLVFTKCDLIEGFVPFFDDLNKTEREQIWGCTLKRRTASDPPPKVQFEQEFRQLVENLQARRLERLTSARGSSKLKIFSFPLQLVSCQPVLSQFVELLFHPNPYQENPFFRGFYFTSGTQEGSPIDRIIENIGRASGLQGFIQETREAVETKSYFIKNLFTEVIFPDHVLATPSSAVFRQRGVIRVAIFGLSILAVGLSIFVFGSSYLGNKLLIESVQDDSVKAMHIRGQVASQVTSPQFAANVELLDSLRAHLDELRHYEDQGVPVRLWGFYEAERLYEPLKTLYHREFNSFVLQPTQQGMEAQLSRFSTLSSLRSDAQDKENYYSLFKAYLMLADREHLNPLFLTKQLQRMWDHMVPGSFYNGEIVLDDPVKAAVDRLLHYYSYHLAGDGTEALNLNSTLVRNVRAVFRQIPLTQRSYDQVLNEASDGLEPFTLQVALQGHQQPHLVSDYQIPGIFTKEGWEKAFRENLGVVLENPEEEHWVLGEKEPVQDELIQAVQVRYFGEFAQHWFRFLESIHIRSNLAAADILNLLEDLNAKPSPFTLLLGAVKKNTGLIENSLGQAIEGDTGFIEKMKRKLLSEESSSGGSPIAVAFNDPVYQDFQSIHKFVTPPEGQETALAPLDQYLKELSQIYATLQGALPTGGAVQDPIKIAQSIAQEAPNDLTNAFTTVQQLTLRLDLQPKRVLEPLLLEPILLAMQGVTNGALTKINERWRSEVYMPCQQTIASGYPFQQDGEDVALADVSDFFHPHNGTLWTFFDKQLKPFLHEEPQGWQVRNWRGVSLHLNPAILESLRYARYLSESLFQNSQSGPKVSFDLYPYPDQGPSASHVSQIRLQIGDQDLLYSMGPQVWQEMTWPGSSGSTGALLQIKLDGAWEPREAQGWWGFFRLLETARVIPINDSTFKVVWAFQSRDDRPLRIQYDLKARSSKNPFHADFFKRFSCPSSLAQM